MALAVICLFATDARASTKNLDLSGYRISFDERFSTLDISADGTAARWAAHTPWHGDFGDAVFDDPGAAGPFAAGKDGLTITAHRDRAGRWHSGLLCSVDRDGAGQHGFTQRYGYFEMTAKLPDGPGVWPAFWLIGADKTHGSAEIDVLEYYGVSNQVFHSNQHLWIAGRDVLHRHQATVVPAAMLSQRFNRFGVLIAPDRTSFYLNRRRIWSTPTPAAYRQNFYLLADLALGGGWPIDRLASPQVLQIQSIQVFQRMQP